MAANEHVAGGERKGVISIGKDCITITMEEYLVLKAKADLYDEYLKQSRFYNKTVANKNHEDDGK